MIIRSQDKKSITTDLNLQIYADDWSDKFGIMDSKGAELGLYSTAEKAIKVLDMIYEQYQLSIHNCKVFQMPQDSEV